MQISLRDDPFAYGLQPRKIFEKIEAEKACLERRLASFLLVIGWMRILGREPGLQDSGTARGQRNIASRERQCMDAAINRANDEFPKSLRPATHRVGSEYKPSRSNDPRISPSAKPKPTTRMKNYPHVNRLNMSAGPGRKTIAQHWCGWNIADSAVRAVSCALPPNIAAKH